MHDNNLVRGLKKGPQSSGEEEKKQIRLQQGGRGEGRTLLLRALAI